MIMDIDKRGQNLTRLELARIAVACSGELALTIGFVFKALGLDKKHGTLSKYVKHLSESENAMEGRWFLKMRARYITMRKNIYPAMPISMRNADQLWSNSITTTRLNRQDGTTLKADSATLTIERTSHWEFVQTDHWNTEVDGVFDQSKGIMQVILGKKREGILVPRGREETVIYTF